MKYNSTRGDKEGLSFTSAILKTTARDRGLYVPDSLPTIPYSFCELNFHDFLASFLNLYGLSGDFLPNDVFLWIKKAYHSFEKPYNLSSFDDCEFLDLYHGPTHAFKDMALAPLGVIISKLLEIENKTGIVLGATSGDTGPAAMRNVASKNVRVHILYPEGGTSEGQLNQMDFLSKNIENAHAYSIKNATFDDCQKLVKDVFNSKDFENQLYKEGFQLLAINSINIFRIILQAAYIAYIVRNKEKKNELQNISIPSGNFGQALGAYIAKKMGVQIGTILIASNENNILTRVIKTGKYFPNQAVKTNSPAMDIDSASNFERLLYLLFGSKKTKMYMQSLEKDGGFELLPADLQLLQENFIAETASQEETKDGMREVYGEYNKIICPHTSVAYIAMKKAKLTNCLVFSTAHPAKFVSTVMDVFRPSFDIIQMLQRDITLSDFNLLTSDEFPYEADRKTFSEVLNISTLQELLLSGGKNM